MRPAHLIPVIIVLSMVRACSGTLQLNRIKESGLQATAVTYDKELARRPVMSEDDKESPIMNAIVDEEGNTTPTDVIQTAYIVSRHKQVSERQGKVQLEFDIVVPKEICNPAWQVRIIPELTSSEGSTDRLDSIMITGIRYRDNQDRGYEKYERYLKSLLPLDDDELFLYKRDLRIFLERYAANPFGISEEEAVMHYTKNWLKRLNMIRHSRIDAKRERYIKAPYILGGVRIDTIISSADSSIIYRYHQEVNTVPKMKYLDLSMITSVNMEGKSIYRKCSNDTLRFYISSLSSLADKRTRYVRHISKRDSVVIYEANIRFASGRHEFDGTIAGNLKEISKIQEMISDMTDDRDIIIDSITIFGAASPEGRYEYNRRLSEARADEMADETIDIIERIRNSRGHFFYTSVEDISSIDTTTNIKSSPVHAVPVDYSAIKRSIRRYGKGEDWEGFEKVLMESKAFDDREKKKILEAIYDTDPDRREASMKKLDYYDRISDSLFNKIRNVKYLFYLHKKDAIEDTVYTTEIDTTYMKGVRYLDERDYKKALDCLNIYRDYNTGLSFLLMGYNHSAIATLESVRKSAARDYLLAVAYSRTGDTVKASYYLKEAVRQDESFRYRSRLDPECSVLTI